jgi:hypothetical protein
VRPEAGGLRLRAVLQGEHPFRGEARVGAAFISEEDRLAWEAARGEGAGPERLEALANVAEWRPVEVTPSAWGGTLGPVPVPPAPRYRVLAWEPDGTFWWGDFVPGEVPASGELDAGVLRARRPTGVRVRLAGARPEQGTFSVRVERVVAPDSRDVESASELLPVVRHAAPALAEALAEGTFIPLSPAEDTPLLPLPPDPAVRLWLRADSGRVAGPVEVPLREGRVEGVTLEVAALFGGGVGSRVTLRGRLLLEGSSAPPPGARLLGPDGRAVALAPDGRFTAEGLPSWQPSRFTAEVEAPASGRPVAPARWDFDFTPRPEGGEAEVTWRVPAFRWLVLRLDAFARGRLGARRPYPVFLLQRRDAREQWRTHAAEAFIPEEAGVAVSLLEPGTYRVLAAASPYEVYFSGSARVDEGPEHAVSLRVDEGGVPCEVRVTRAGAPVYGALVTAGSAYGSLPPVRGRTDAEGRWRLGPVRVDSLHLEVQVDGRPAWAGELASACEVSDVVEVRL